MNRIPFFSLLGILALMASCNGPKLLTDSIQYKKGDTYTYEQVSDIVSTVSIMGQEVINKQKQGYTFENKIENLLANGDIDMSSTVKGIVYEMEAMGKKMKYNSMDKSKNENAESLVGIYDGMLGTQFKLLLDSKGQLKNFSGANAMIDKMSDQMKKDGLPTEGLEMMKNQFNDEEMMNMYGNNMSSLLPTTPVKIGDSWNKAMDVKLLGMKFDIKYTLAKIEGGKAYLDVMGSGAPIPDAEPMEMMGMTMKYNLSGTQTGTVVVDLKTGFPLKSTITQDYDGTMKMSGGMLPGEMDADMSIQGETTYTQK